MVNDTEPRYRLVDSGGTVVGSLYAESDGTLKLQEGTSGSDNEVSIATDGTFTAPTVSTGSLAFTPGAKWTEDANSPLFINGSTSGTITLDGEYDAVQLIMTGGTGNTEVLDMQINGDTGANYDYLDNGDNTTSGATAWEGVSISARSVGQIITLSGRFGEMTMGTSVHAFASGRTVGGRNTNVNSPLESITIKSGSSFTSEFTVFGLDR